MSNDFDILEYIKKNPDWWKQSRPTYSFALESLNQDSEDDRIQGLSNVMLRRHHPVINIQPPITIRQVRHITIPNGEWPGHPRERNPHAAPPIVVNSVRSYARKSHTSRYWQDAGWKRRYEDGYQWLSGHYKAKGNLYRGSIKLADSVVQPIEYYIYDPPRVILSGPHGACYQWRISLEPNKYLIHFSKMPADIDSGIIQIEQNLSEALEME
ncbi:MAG: hypothetical protein PHW60_03720 [Kiritimatiellae bacterium]|nr:hypothetical protein [Kiritimatiellia bacterium]